jgi:hypothetical protein
MMKSQSDVFRDLDTMRDILAPLDDDGRESILAIIILWFLVQYTDRDAAIDRLIERVAELERDIEGSILQ